MQRSSGFWNEKQRALASNLHQNSRFGWPSHHARYFPGHIYCSDFKPQFFDVLLFNLYGLPGRCTQLLLLLLFLATWHMTLGMEVAIASCSSAHHVHSQSSRWRYCFLSTTYAMRTWRTLQVDNLASGWWTFDRADPSGCNGYTSGKRACFSS